MMRYVTPSSRRRRDPDGAHLHVSQVEARGLTAHRNDDDAIGVLDLLVAIPAFELVLSHLEVEERDRSFNRRDRILAEERIAIA